MSEKLDLKPGDVFGYNYRRIDGGAKDGVVFQPTSAKVVEVKRSPSNDSVLVRIDEVPATLDISRQLGSPVAGNGVGSSLFRINGQLVLVKKA